MMDGRLVLALFRYLPSPPLSAIVEAFCFYEGDASGAPKKERCLPTGQVAMVINLGHDTLRVAHLPHADQLQRFHGGVLTGAFSQFSVIDTTTMIRTLSICFKPGGARLFLPMPAAKLANQVVGLSCIFGNAAGDLREHLQATRTNDERVRILERFLLARTCWEHAPHPAVGFALTSFQDGNERPSISEVTTQLGMSPKRFISLFEEAVGTHPTEDEIFYVLQGALTFRCGEETFELENGGFVFLPRGIPHGYTIRSDGEVRVLVVTAPAPEEAVGGWGGFVADIEAAGTLRATPPKEG